MTVGCDGEPSVRTWQDGGGVALLAHTLAVVNPPAGKPKVWAEAICDPRPVKIKPVKKRPVNIPRTAKLPRSVLFIIFVVSIFPTPAPRPAKLCTRHSVEGTLTSTSPDMD